MNLEFHDFSFGLRDLITYVSNFFFLKRIEEGRHSKVLSLLQFCYRFGQCPGRLPYVEGKFHADIFHFNFNELWWVNNMNNNYSLISVMLSRTPTQHHNKELIINMKSQKHPFSFFLVFPFDTLPFCAWIQNILHRPFNVRLDFVFVLCLCPKWEYSLSTGH